MPEIGPAFDVQIPLYTVRFGWTSPFFNEGTPDTSMYPSLRFFSENQMKLFKFQNFTKILFLPEIYRPHSFFSFPFHSRSPATYLILRASSHESQIEECSALRADGASQPVLLSRSGQSDF